MGAEDLEALRFVGPHTAARLDDAGIAAEDVRERRVSHARLVDAGVNPGVAARIRRAHSLPWSFDSGGEDLDARARQVRGLGEAERAWVEASSGDWQAGQAAAERAEESEDADLLERNWPGQDGERSAPEPVDPEPVTSIDGVGEARSAQLAEAGVTTVRGLSVADPEALAESLDLAASRVREWHAAATAHLEERAERGAADGDGTGGDDREGDGDGAGEE